MAEINQDLDAVIARYSPYIQEIRKRLLNVVIVFGIGAVAGFIYFDKIINFIFEFYQIDGINIVFTSPFQFINLSINAGVIVGVLITLPLILHHLLAFLSPALKAKEYKMLVSAIPISIVLFIAGFAFGFWIMKIVAHLFSLQSAQLQVENIWDIENFLGNIFSTALFLGIFFQFPLIVSTLIRLHAITLKKVSSLRIPIYIGLLIMTMLLPPTDLVSNAFIFLPLVFLFEMTLLFNRNIKQTPEEKLYVR
jgi:sec-independent protein translocase protein TatC